MNGLSHPGGLRLKIVAAFGAVGFGLTVLGQAPAFAQTPSINIPATTLDQALIALSRQTGSDIASTESGLARVRVPAVTGKLKTAQALTQLLAGSNYRARRVNGSFIIQRIPPARQVRSSSSPPVPTAPGEIIVTASKQRIDLRKYPGSLTLTSLGRLGTTGTPDTDALARTLPIVEATALGPGRNKLFVRGIADSSFNGATQSTASTYFGDVQLGYSGADPDLKLIDVERIEILEGPQGTLYGAGAIGGIIRITPNPVDLARAGGSLSLGGALTDSGSPSYDASAVLNLPVLNHQAGVRLVGYHSREGGYIDDRQRKLTDINSTVTSGVRGAVMVDPGDGWKVEGSALWQSIDTDDTGYAQSNRPPLTRRSTLAQPFASDIVLGRLVVTKKWDSGLELLSTTALVHYRSTEDFDASATPAAPQLYRNELGNRLLTEEARLSNRFRGGSWVIGLALLDNSNEQSRAQGSVDNPGEIVGVTNIARSASVFGEVTLPTFPHLALTLGARATLARNEATPTVRLRGQQVYAGQETKRIDPTVALTYRLEDELSVYARFQTGYRTGGLAVARGVGRTAAFAGDDIIMGELGFRFIHQAPRPLTLSGAVAYARWNNIQADLFSRLGQPFTTNLGDARILTLEGNAHWEPIKGLGLQGAILYADNSVDGPIANTSVRNNRRLAQVPSIAANAAIDYAWSIRGKDRMRVAATADYFDEAVLGTGDFLDIRHPRYTVLGSSLSWTHHGLTTTLSADNLLNITADRFSLGNPLMIASRNQITPLRPRTVRLGVTIGW